MDFAGLHVKVNVVAGKNAGESFRNAAHLQVVDSSTPGRKFVSFGHGCHPTKK
jgi:hypothetical protein